jgi:hypothetical protein
VVPDFRFRITFRQTDKQTQRQNKIQNDGEPGSFIDIFSYFACVLNIPHPLLLLLIIIGFDECEIYVAKP